MRVRGVALLLAVLAVSTVWAGPAYDVTVVVNNSEDLNLVNTVVTVRGLVMNPRVSDSALAEYKQLFNLTDEKGNSLLVEGTTPPPPPGVRKSVTGKLLKNADGDLVLRRTNGLNLSDWRVWALAALLIVAVVLIVMLTGDGRARRGPVDDGDEPRGEDHEMMECRQCGRWTRADGTFCDKCGKPPSGDEPTSDEGTVHSGSQPAGITVVDRPQHMALLIVKNGSGAVKGKDFRVNDRKRHTIGRANTADVSLPGDSKISSEHAAIWWDDQVKAFMVQDKASTNGTFVNGNVTSGAYQLQDNDEIGLGDTRLKLTLLE